MSENNWISARKTRTKDELARVVLSELIDREKVCYYCLMNKCNSKDHDRRNQKLQRCKVFFNKLIYDPRNYSKDFETTLYKAIHQKIGKKYKIKSKSCHITSCQSSLMGRKCYNQKDGNFFKFQFEGQEFVACHKNPESCRGRLPVCVHCDFSKVNRKITMIPCKEREQSFLEKNLKGKGKPNLKGKDKPNLKGKDAPNLKGKDKPNLKGKDKPEEIKPTNPNSWAGRLNNRGTPPTNPNWLKKNDVKEFLEKVVPFANKKITIPLHTEGVDNDAVSGLDVLKKENKMLKQFISDKYDKNTTSIFKKLIREDNTRLEKLCLNVNKNREKVIDLWEDNKLLIEDEQEQSEWITA